MDNGLTYIFVHGLSGWGSYDAAYKLMPYWGMRGGDLIKYLRREGYACYAASVSPSGSAWDRACELYAQLAGTRVDYGEAHARKYRHQRFGRDFSSCPLIPCFDDDTRLVLLGHSFGGATVRMLAELMAHGDAGERETRGPSRLFLGGMEKRIHALVTLASPLNGTTAYDLFGDAAFRSEKVRVPWWSRMLARMMDIGTRPKKDGRDKRDCAAFDMHVDNALSLNRRFKTQTGVYYFSVPCSATFLQPDGTYRPNPKKMEIQYLFVQRACQIGCWTGKTAGGFIIDENWLENDGLVNTISARAPIGEAFTPLDETDIHPGVWNVFPTFNGDHMSLQGGLLKKRDIRPFYMKLLRLIPVMQNSDK